MAQTNQIPDDLTLTPPTTQATSAPSTSTAIPDDLTATPLSQPETLGQKVSRLGEEFVDTMPGVGAIHQAAGATENWANKEMQKPSVFLSPAKTFGAGVLRDVSGLVHEATGPVGLAETVGAVAAPEVVGPVMIAQGGAPIYKEVKSIYNGTRGWGDLENPDVLQNMLMDASQVAGGAATTGEGWKGVQASKAYKKANSAPTQELQDFKNAVPPTKSAPYEDEDYAAARPYIREASETSGVPANTIQGAKEAADTAISKIENFVQNAIRNDKTDVKLNGPGLIKAVKDRLTGNLRTDFLQAGMRELERWPLGFERADGVVDPAIDLAKADDIRHQLNTENRAFQAKNNLQLRDAYDTDPAFAARAAAAELLRDWIYDRLNDLGVPGAEALRADEGSIIKVRNALQDKIYQGEKTVKPTGTVSRSLKKIGQRTMRAGGTLGGYALGQAVGHPIIGVGVGEQLGETAAEHFLPENPTRDELIERSFKNLRAGMIAPRTRVTPQTVKTGAIAGATQDQRRIFFRSSDGRIHSVPIEQIDAARQVDPNLEIINAPEQR